jgi:hypothetical protein
VGTYRSELHPQLSPGIEVVASGNGTRSTRVSTDAPVLLEGGSSLDGRQIVYGARENIIHATIAGNSAHVSQIAARFVGAVILDDVVLDKGVGRRPSVDGKIRISTGRVGT